MAAATTSPHQQHNKDVLNQLSRGDLVQFGRGRYSHWALYIGDSKVIHMTGLSVDGKGNYTSLFSVPQDKAEIKEDNFWEVAGMDKADFGNMEHEGWTPLDTEEIIKRARDMIGPVTYHCITENCEHIAKWFRYDRKESQQAEIACKFIVLTIAILLGFAVVVWVRKDKKIDADLEVVST